MRTSVSLTYPTWNDKVDNNVLYLSETSNVNEVMVRSISFGEKDVELVLRTFSFKRKELEALTNLDNKSIQSPKSDLLVNKECKDTMPVIEQNKQHIHKSRREMLLPKPLLLPSPRPISELDVAATKVQKVYKSYRTRRNLADCAVVVEELWWKALDFAALSRSSVSYFNNDKHETAVSRWVRARTKAAKVGKGLLKDEKAQKLALQHWLEAIDPRHRYGHNLHFYYDIWSESKSAQPFFYWLDIGDGKEFNLERCLRVNLQRQCIKYLGPKEREAYQVVVEDGKLVYEQSGMLLNTEEGSKWIFVLSTSRSLYVGQKKKGVFQHSSFLSGGATSAAGRLVAHDGILEAIWPYSGHYLPTEDNFKEFISFLEEHRVDMTNVKRCAVDDDTYSSIPVDATVKEPGHVSESQESEVHTSSATQTESKISEVGCTQEPKFDLAKRMSCKWSSGVGPRIGCVRDYPMELQSQAMEKVSLSPKNNTPGHSRSYVPIPSPRPNSRVRMSPRLAYMGLPSPRLTVPAAN